MKTRIINGSEVSKLSVAIQAKLWGEITAEHSLKEYPYEKIVAWKFGDFIFKTEFDNITSTIKARQHGFQACIDTEDMFIEILQELRDQRFIP